MPLILEQRFPLGRFHATRWRQNPFEDRHGEWPPSPWRFLRALAARWIQYSRETGSEDIAARDELLSRLSGEVPEFAIPAMTWRAEPALRQYHKTAVEWTAKGKKDPAYKKSMTTLVPDVCRAIPPDDIVIWSWPNLTLSAPLQQLLGELITRMLYFGRAESFCLLRRLEQLPDGVSVNCRLTATSTDQSPVLVPKPGEPLNLKSLLAASDDEFVRGHPVPPGSAWHYATIPQRPTMQRTSIPAPRSPATLQVVQFAVGGRVYPHVRDWIRVTERFRGAALKELARRLTDDRNAKFARLPPDLRDEFALFSGKSGEGTPVSGHAHAYFALLPDEFGQPTRLLCFRREPFRAEEITALLAAADRPCSWRFERQRGPNDRHDEWQLRFVPLPFDTPPPIGFSFDVPISSTWISATPFVIPGGRIRFRKHGRLRPGETADRLLEKLLTAAGYPTPELSAVTNETEEEWVAVHEPPEQRQRRREARTRAVLPGHRFCLEFPKAVSGPICIGHSCHFGLGLFVPSTERPARCSEVSR
jgi:CRISPR-associated protein Csb2